MSFASESSPPQPVPPRNDAALKWVLAFAIGLLVVIFAALTRAVWEDYYITFRSSRNLVDGHGLVYHVGDRLHTFTSPLGVLLPALTYAITGTADGAIWLFRIFSAGALGTAAWLLTGALQGQRWSRVSCVLAAGLGLASLKNIEFAANGMESAFLVLFTILAFVELIRPEGIRIPRLAAAFAGLMWTRPDAFVIAGGLAAGAVLFAEKDTRKDLFKKGLIAAALGFALYAPWLIFATVYYGSPIPQTITAKAAITPAGLSLLRILLSPLRCLATNGSLTEALAPEYWSIQLWGADWHNLWGILARIAAFAWLWPRAPRAARIASFALLLGGIYLDQVSVFPWYLTPWCALAGVALAGFCAQGWKQAGSAVRIGLSLALLSGIVVLVAGGITAERRQVLIEEQIRGAIGLWLKEHARQDDTVFLEPIGYIGYYAGDRVRITDYPGLTSRAVSDETARGATTFAELIPRLRPDWLVLRPHEIMDENLVKSGELAKSYDYRGGFSNREHIMQESWMPGRRWMVFDSEFHIYERKRAPAETAPAAKPAKET